MTQEELFYPVVKVQIGEYCFQHGVVVAIYSDSREPVDWGKLKFTKEFRDRITIASGDEVTIYQGYGSRLQQTFKGIVVKPYNSASGENEILFKDRMHCLEKVFINNTFRHVSPQEIIRYGLAAAGIMEYRLSETAYQAKERVPVLQKNMIGVLQQISSIWGIDQVKAGFINGIFYWGEFPERKAAVFAYGNNIIALNRANGMWELETVCQPDVQKGQTVLVQHPKISGMFEVIRVVTFVTDKGFVRCRIYFSGGTS